MSRTTAPSWPYVLRTLSATRCIGNLALVATEVGNVFAHFDIQYESKARRTFSFPEKEPSRADLTERLTKLREAGGQQEEGVFAFTS